MELSLCVCVCVCEWVCACDTREQEKVEKFEILCDTPVNKKKWKKFKSNDSIQAM